MSKRKFVFSALVVALAAVAVQTYPDVARYRKIRDM